MNYKQLEKDLLLLEYPEEEMKKMERRLQEGDFLYVINILKRNRANLMNQYHDSVRKIDCIDYILWNIEKNR
ncbi:MAG: hypothetical protein IJ875_07130 [Solobacterium sp.]|nr:hypothetical protein [Solobacterium sp.]